MLACYFKTFRSYLGFRRLYSLSQTAKFPIKQLTRSRGVVPDIPYFVSRNFNALYRRDANLIHQVEQSVQKEYYHRVQDRCHQEKTSRKRRLQKAKKSKDKGMFMRPIRLPRDGLRVTFVKAISFHFFASNKLALTPLISSCLQSCDGESVTVLRRDNEAKRLRSSILALCTASHPLRLPLVEDISYLSVLCMLGREVLRGGNSQSRDHCAHRCLKAT